MVLSFLIPGLPEVGRMRWRLMTLDRVRRTDPFIVRDGAGISPFASFKINFLASDNVANVFEFNDSQTIAPHLNLTVTMNVILTGVESADALKLTAFTQRIAQTGPASLAGDFNNDKRVDGSDFLRWQRGQSPTPLSQLDLNVWRVNFGQSILAASALSPVPESSTALLLSLGDAAAHRRARCLQLAR